MNRQQSKRHPAPFKRGSWVTPADSAHPMKGKRGMVIGVEYTGQGVTDQHLVTITFENVHPRQRNEWTFRHQDLTIAPPKEVPASHHGSFNFR